MAIKRALAGVAILGLLASPVKANTKNIRVGYISKNGIELMIGESKRDFRFEFGLEEQKSRSGIRIQLEHERKYRDITTAVGLGLFHGYGPNGTYNQNPYVLLKLNTPKIKNLSAYLETTGIIPLNPNFELPKTRLTLGVETNF